LALNGLRLLSVLRAVRAQPDRRDHRPVQVIRPVFGGPRGEDPTDDTTTHALCRGPFIAIFSPSSADHAPLRPEAAMPTAPVRRLRLTADFRAGKLSIKRVRPTPPQTQVWLALVE
jgi:hypothetical protein